MNLAIASLNPAIERLLVVRKNVLGRVHTMVRDETLAGGKGVNVARVFSQLSTEEFFPSGAIRPVEVVPMLIGPLGGATGGMMRKLLFDEDIQGRWVDIHASTRTNEIVVDQSDPENATVYNSVGPRIDPLELELLREAASRSLDGAAALICTGSIPPGVTSTFYAEWITQATARGIPSLLDAHGQALAEGAVAAPTIIKVNRDELIELSKGEDPEAKVESWLTGGTVAVIVTDGSRPTVAVTTNGRFEVSPPEVEAVSAVGSGDAFTAGLMWSILFRPDGWARHLSLATASGASNAAGIHARLHQDAPPARLEASVNVRIAPSTQSTQRHRPEGQDRA